MDLLDIVVYFAVAAIGSAINAAAGGGTFLVFPVLIMSGLGALAANIMCTIALWPGTVASTLAFRRERPSVEPRFLRKLLMISILGSALGAGILLMTPERAFAALVPWLLLVATLIFTFKIPSPYRGEEGRGASMVESSQVSPPSSFAKASEDRPNLPLAGGGIMLLIALYGGYFGAGIGILMLALLRLMGMTHIHSMNALKAVLGTAINAVAFFVFIFSDQVRWDVAAVMIPGAVLGGFFGARLSLLIPPAILRRLISLTGFSMSAYFFLKDV